MSVLFQRDLANLFFITFLTIFSIVPLPNPIPAQECTVFALHSRRTAAQPVKAQT